MKNLSFYTVAVLSSLFIASVSHAKPFAEMTFSELKAGMPVAIKVLEVINPEQLPRAIQFGGDENRAVLFPPQNNLNIDKESVLPIVEMECDTGFANLNVTVGQQNEKARFMFSLSSKRTCDAYTVKDFNDAYDGKLEVIPFELTSVSHESMWYLSYPAKVYFYKDIAVPKGSSFLKFFHPENKDYEVVISFKKAMPIDRIIKSGTEFNINDGHVDGEKRSVYFSDYLSGIRFGKEVVVGEKVILDLESAAIESIQCKAINTKRDRILYPARCTKKEFFETVGHLMTVFETKQTEPVAID